MDVGGGGDVDGGGGGNGQMPSSPSKTPFTAAFQSPYALVGGGDGC